MLACVPIFACRSTCQKLSLVKIEFTGVTHSTHEFDLSAREPFLT